jgi:hypothetical protein
MILEIKVLFKLSKDINPNIKDINFGKYKILPLPTNSADIQDSKVKYLLEFEDIVKESDYGSQPFIESQFLLSFISLIFGCKLEIDSITVNGVKSDMPNPQLKGIYKEYAECINEIPDLNNLLNRIMSSDEELAIQILRAIEVYHTAINLLAVDNTLSYFLLSISIECLSNKIINDSPDDGTCDKFIKFILKYLPDKQGFKNDAELKLILKEVYYNHRSGFTHGGKSIPDAVFIADKFNKPYIKNFPGDKEIKTPGLKWFENVVRKTLINFIQSIEIKEKNKLVDYFKEISLHYGMIRVKFKKIMDKGQFVYEKDLDLE